LVQAADQHLTSSSTKGVAVTSDRRVTAAIEEPTLGALLNGWRKRALLTQEQLADRSGVSVRTIRKLEAGQVRRPHSQSLQRLAGALGLSDQERTVLSAAQQPAAAGRRPAPAVPARQLPMDVPGFTGRAEQLAQLDALLPDSPEGSPGTVVITVIAGTAGVGKTALAVHWAYQVGGRFPDGQLYVSLHGYAPGPPLGPLPALAQLLGALGVTADRVPVQLDQAAGLYRSLLAGKRMLVVLDNARSAEQVRPLLPGSPGCLVLITSRDRLDGLVASHGANRLLLDVLSPTEAVSLVGHIIGERRVAAEPQATGELVRACAFLPLAVRIAAANLAGHPGESIATYVARLRQGDRLAELAVDGDPHAAVGAAFDRSYTTLSPDAQRMFRQLGLVPGPEVTAWAAAALAGAQPEQARRLLERLSAAHLVEPRASGRFGFHDLLRRYAYQRTLRDDSARERQQTERRLLSWYLHTAAAAVGLLYPGRLHLPIPTPAPGLPQVEFEERADALAWLRAERANLVSAVTHAAEHGHRPAAWLLADTLRGYFWHHRHMTDWLTVAQAGLTAAAATDDLRAQAAGHRSLGMAWGCLGDYGQAANHHTSALRLARQAGWADGEAASLASLGLTYRDLGRLQDAADHLTQALARYRQTGSNLGEAVTLVNLGAVVRELGWPEHAAEHVANALAMSEKIGSQGAQIAALGTLGELDHDLGRLDDAQRHLSRSLALTRDLGDRYGEAHAMCVLARVYRDAGSHTQAMKVARASLALTRELREPRTQAEALTTLGSIHLRRGRPHQAVARYRQALGLSRQTDARYPETEALLGLAAAHRELGQDSRAVECAQQALVVAHKAGYRILEGQARTALAASHRAHGQHDQGRVPPAS
jgi:tetratricopeptide (TPR) repeat protein/transcriptional regulator with XRE-family HTH domain